MSELNRQDIITTGRYLYHQKVYELYRKLLPAKVKDEKSPLEKANADIEKMKTNFGKSLSAYLETVADKSEETKSLTAEIGEPFKEYIANDLSELTEEQRKEFAVNLESLYN